MCYNSQVSLLTFIIGMLGSSKLFYDGHKPHAIFYAWVVLMQLVEFFLWNNQPCNDTNKKVTKIGMFINHMEPIALWIGILLFSSKILPLEVNLLMFFFFLLSFIYSNKLFKKGLECTSPSDDSKPYLEWKWNRGEHKYIYYTVFIIALILLSLYGLDDGKFQASLIGGSYILSYYLYGEKKAIGNMWCFMAAFAPWVTIIKNNIN